VLAEATPVKFRVSRPAGLFSAAETGWLKSTLELGAAWPLQVWPAPLGRMSAATVASFET